MIYGLGQYQRDDFTSAATSFTQADQSPSWVSPQGKEVLYLFAGFNAGKRIELDAAADYFAHAERYDSTRIRAQLGTAETAVQRFGVQQNCTQAATDLGQLHAAANSFHALIDRPSRVGGASIDAKAHFGLGQIAVCVSQAQLEDRWVDARDEFNNVLAVYQAGDETIKYLAAESYANLGFLSIHSAGEAKGSQRDEHYRLALEQYQRAVGLSDAHPTRQAFFYSRVGDIAAQLGQLDTTEDAYAAAISLDPAKSDTYQQQLERARTLHG
jgi:tetratricopeptide (TPR) repeat protein